MSTQNTTPKYRLTVLMDLSKTSEIALANAVQLAKTLNGSIEVLYVKSPADVVKYDNQLSAIRAMHENNRKAKNAIQALIDEVNSEESLQISFKMGHGNVKNAIKDYMLEAQPDILVLGKKKPKVSDLFGDGITEYVLNECPSHVLITGERYEILSFANVQLGIFGDSKHGQDVDIIQDLRKNNNHPMRMFGIKTDQNDEALENHNEGGEVISYIFSKGSNAWDGITSYVSRTNTQLFCMPRRSKDNTVKPSTTKRLLQKLEVPILIMAS